MSSQEIATRVTPFFESYRSAFERFDPEGIADHFSYPCLVIGDAPNIIPLAIASVEEWITQLRQLVVGYQAIGVSSARILDLSVMGLSPRLMQATVSWQLLTASREPLYDFRAIYSLAEKDGHLKIAAIAHDETPKFLAVLKKAKTDRPPAAGGTTRSA